MNINCSEFIKWNWLTNWPPLTTADDDANGQATACLGLEEWGEADGAARRWGIIIY